MIQVGIHDNLRIYKATKNDKGSLVMGVKSVEVAGLGSFDQVGSNTAAEEKENDFLFFPPQATDRNKQPDTAKNNGTKIKEFKDQLNAILMNYLPTNKIAWDSTKGTGMTMENMDTKLTQQATLDQMYKNIVDQFIAMITPFLNNDKLLFRFLFVRSSPTKNFPALRRRYLDRQPFMEPMTVAKEASKLAYTKWEIDNKYNNPDKITVATADAPDPSEVEQTEQQFFGQPATA